MPIKSEKIACKENILNVQTNVSEKNINIDLMQIFLEYLQSYLAYLTVPVMPFQFFTSKSFSNTFFKITSR
jgi:hypothetical protein